MQPKHLKFTLLVLLFLSWVTACTGELATEPALPLPSPTISAEVTAVLTSIPVPTATLEQATSEPAPTEMPTVAPTVTATATPIIETITSPPIQRVTGQPLPPISHDLLFLADGSFKRWNHSTGQIETIIASTNPAARRIEDPYEVILGSITDYSLSSNGQRAVVARVIDTATNTNLQYARPEFTYELLLVDLTSREVWPLVAQVDNLETFQLSPDAQQLVFVGSGLDGIPDASSSDPIATNLYLMPTDRNQSDAVQKVYSCQTRCIQPEWHQESNLVAFGDSVALWAYTLATVEPEMLIENQGYVLGMADVGEISIYSPLEWASNGRYLLLWRGRWEGGARAVLDMETGKLAGVPDSFAYADLYYAEFGWMPDNRLVAWRTEKDEDNLIPTLELWRFDEAAGKLILEESARLSEQQMAVAGGMALADGRFTFYLHNYEPADEAAFYREIAGTYQLTSLTDTPSRVNTLPPVSGMPRAAETFWLPDGSGALMSQFGPPPNIYYAPTNGEFLYDLTAVFGRYPHAFQWQPKIVAP